MSALKDSVDAYVAGMERSAAKGVDAVGEQVQGFPEARVDSLPDGLTSGLIVVGLADDDLHERARQFGADCVEGCSCGGCHSPNLGDSPPPG